MVIADHLFTEVLMSVHLVVGSGAVGAALTRLLVDQGDRVTVVTRSGTGLKHPAVRRVAADASDADVLSAVAEGAETVTNCANPQTYQQWVRLWPPLAASLLRTAERSGAVLVTTSNVYGYGPVDVPLTTDLPLAATGPKGRLRAQMWQDAFDAHRAGRVRATEVRAADYIGPDITAASGLLRRYADVTLRGRTARVFGDPDMPHTFTAVDDVARLLATVGRDERAWGHAWHVPSPDPVTVRQALSDLASHAPGGAPAPRISRFPRAAVSALAPVVPVLRELREVLWQWERPFELDASLTTATFGLRARPWDGVVSRAAAAWSPA
jgi:nucleoside-diphosphate-sugar epimerase